MAKVILKKGANPKKVAKRLKKNMIFCKNLHLLRNT